MHSILGNVKTIFSRFQTFSELMQSHESIIWSLLELTDVIREFKLRQTQHNIKKKCVDDEKEYKETNRNRRTGEEERC